MRIVSQSIPHGLFGSTFTWILEVLYYLDNESIPHTWDIVIYNTNINNLLIQRKLSKNKTYISDFYALKLQHGKNEKLNYDFVYANKLWNKYFDFKQYIYDMVPHIDEHTLGVHYRGTDKLKDKKETNPLSVEEFYIILKDFLLTHKVKHIFICTDHKESLEYLLGKSKEYNVKYNSFIRSSNTTPIHNSQNKIKAVQSIVDMLTLSKCRYVLKSSSALSSWAKIVNPDLEIYATQAFKKKYFPNSCIPLYKPFFSDAIEIMKKSCVEHYIHSYSK